MMRQLGRPNARGTAPQPGGPVVVWNVTRRCNLDCLHCYSASSDRQYGGELTTAESLALLDDLKACRVPSLILSGGEPLLRPDLLDLAGKAKSLGLHLGLSSNGTLLSPALAEGVARAGFDYVGISLDGMEANHDRIRGRAGAFRQALTGLRACRDHGVKVGLRFTLTGQTVADLEPLLALATAEGVDRIYLSHLNFAGRAGANRQEAPDAAATRGVMERIFALAWADRISGAAREFVSGNNDADGPFLLQWLENHHPDLARDARERLRRWGGNASGVGIANIDNRGFVHPDIFWWHHPLGNVRETPFARIWWDEGARDPLLAGLRLRPRPLQGRCARCSHLDICGGNTRVRAWQTTGNPWASDPGCYLTDGEIGLREEAA
ncbi:MAG: radical SAM protein [Magnetococcales bacterium]|nr:radical SAM protein [Magnetococcales bacterium]